MVTVVSELASVAGQQVGDDERQSKVAVAAVNTQQIET